MTQNLFSELRAANLARQNLWDPDWRIDLAWRGNELGGEAGEACNVMKKIERERRGVSGSRATIADLSEELADVVICADLVAMECAIDLPLDRETVLKGDPMPGDQSLTVRGNNLMASVGKVCAFVALVKGEPSPHRSQFLRGLLTTVVCRALEVADDEGIDLFGWSVPQKFNATSFKMDLPTRLYPDLQVPA